MSFPLNRPANLAVFASGRGSNLASILNAFPSDSQEARVCLVASNVASAAALDKAKQAGIASKYHPFPARKKDPAGQGRAAFEKQAQAWLEFHKIDLICLAGFMRIFSAEFNEHWQGKMLNIHPSLLPDFKGLHPQRQALEAGVKEAGCSVHFVDAGIDTGQIILQKRIPVLATDTEESLAARIVIEEHVAYPEAIKQVLAGKFKVAEVGL